MTWLSLGSLALPHQLQRQGVALRSEIGRLGVELTTGTSAAPQRHLRGDIGPLAAIEARMARIDAYDQSTLLVGLRVNATQSALGQLDAMRSQTATRMLTAASTATTDAGLATAGRSAKAALMDAVATLSLQVSGVAAFSGAATDTLPLPDADAILAAVLPLVSGLDSADAVMAAVTSAFMDPGGLFETTLYQGTDPSAGADLGAGAGTISQPTAADPALRGLLSGLVAAALVADPGLSLSQDQRHDLTQSAAESLLSNAGALTTLQAETGEAQAQLDARRLRFSTERDALELSRSTLIGVDPYAAATRLEEARTQLETLYTVTARTSRLTLTGYL